MVIKPLFVVLYCGRNCLEATVEDDEGLRRRVKIQWSTKEATDVPPDAWLSMVAGELDYQKSTEGRRLPFLG